MPQKKIYCLFAFFLLQFFVSHTFLYAKKGDAYNIKLTTKGYSNIDCYLAYHYGSQVFIKDTFKVDANGVCTFKGDEPLETGIYLAVFPKSKYFEFLVTDKEQKFEMSTDSTNFVKNLVVKKSPENTIFNDYQRFLAQQEERTKSITKAVMDTLKNKADSAKVVFNKTKDIQKEVKEYRLKVIKEKPQSYLAFILNAMSEVEVPDPPKNQKGEIIDSSFQYKYFKAHFFDNLDFNDERILRTPILYNKVKQYLETMVVRHPDSINVAADYILKKADKNKEIFKYLLSHIAGTYESSKIMGMDAVFVHLAQEYYLKGKAYWMDSTRLKKVQERYDKMRYNMIGQKAPELLCQDQNVKTISMHGVPAQYTLILFWSTTCGHCKTEMPHFIELYNKYKDRGLQIYAVCSAIELDKWNEKLKEYQMENVWINVMDMYNQTNYHTTYDVYSTPTTYLLDKDKKIVAKRLGVEQLDDVIESLITRTEKEKTKDKQKK